MARLFRKTYRTIQRWEEEGVINNHGPVGKHPLYDPRDIYPDLLDDEITLALSGGDQYAG